MTTASITATLGTTLTSPGGTPIPNGKYNTSSGSEGDVGALTAATVTDLATTVTDYNAFAAALILITGDTYNTSTLQFTSGGATGLTHAQVATLEGLLNTFGAAQVAAQAAATKANSALSADLILIINQATVTTANALRHLLRHVLNVFSGYGIVSGS